MMIMMTTTPSIDWLVLIDGISFINWFIDDDDLSTSVNNVIKGP